MHSLLICGQPASGKTTLLRDLICRLATGISPRRLTVVDERGELLLDNDQPCEVLLGYPKAVGIEQALRTLSPEGIVFDELGSEEEVKAVLQCLNSGVAAICTLHADGIESLKRRPAARAALQSGAFEYVALLSGRRAP
ncbi:MAG: Flp pilus assembly complex ATPase component TadA, partial [Clostridia bacterium]|nr:Flp pilus assembly complex ATPase component TadA [Clostridia bacterium]